MEHEIKLLRKEKIGFAEDLGKLQAKIKEQQERI